MELRHLRYFCAVADWNGFNRAARALHTSQSSISAQIRDLEQEIGVTLFNRARSRASLTPAGAKFLEEARRLVGGADRAVDVARSTARGEIGSLSIGFVIWGTSAFLPAVIRGFRQLYPGVHLSLMEAKSVTQSEALLKGTIDVAFMRPPEPPFDRQLRSEMLFMDPLVAVLPAGHRLAGRPLRLAALADERFVMFDRSSAPAMFDRIIALCAQAGFIPKIEQTSSHLLSVLTLIQAGEGVTLIPGSLQHFRFSDLALCPLTRPTGMIEWVMAWSPEREDVVKTAFLDFIRSKKKLMRSSFAQALPMRKVK
jgi:DNA-binding transcriptional LysR family regulator